MRYDCRKFLSYARVYVKSEDALFAVFVLEVAGSVAVIVIYERRSTAFG